MLLNRGDGSWPFAGHSADASIPSALPAVPPSYLKEIIHHTENTGSGDHNADDNSENLCR
jgi:hypothetical protein